MNSKFLRQLPPEDQAVSDVLQSDAQSIQVNPVFQSTLEAQLKQAQTVNERPEQTSRIKILPAIGWAILIIGAFLVLNWAVRSLAFNLQPASYGTPIPVVPFESTLNVQNSDNPIPTPSGTEYDWHGTKLYLKAPLPDVPAEASVYRLQPDQPATIESARALAQRFGIEGEIYQAPGELPGTGQFLVTDGKQRLYVRSEQYFTYYADYVNYSSSMFSYRDPLQQGEALGNIDKFLKEHGYDFAYQVENVPQIANDYYILPLSPDGFSLRHDYLMPVRMEVKLDETGQVIFASSSLPAYEQVGTYGIRTAQEAWEKVLAEDGSVGIQESVRSSGILKEKFWQRSYPENETITLYGNVSSFPPVETGGAQFTVIGDYTVSGNIAGLESANSNMVEASGLFRTENGIRRFIVDTWQITSAMETSFMGTLRQDGENIILATDDGSGEYLIQDAPPDLPLNAKIPGEQLSVTGVLINDQLVWSIIQYFPAGSGYGGGGGGGSGFYKLNLTGTPVPLPTPAPDQGTSSETGEYVVQSGDTLSKISDSFGITVEELMQANGLTETTIFVGQTLVIPGAQPEQSPVGQRIEGQRGIVMVNIYRKPDGSQRTEYSFISPQANQYTYLMLEGENLTELEKYHNRPVDIWGTIESVDSYGAITLGVERFEIPYPDISFQIVQGTQNTIEVEGQTVLTITTTDGKTFVQFTAYGEPDSFGVVGSAGNQVLAEALAVPDETFGGYPVLRIHNLSMAINPKNGQPQEMQVTADQPYITDEPPSPSDYTVPTATIDKVELTYYVKDPRYAIPGTSSVPTYIQPVWRFYGHYSNGDEFEILVQALKDEFLLPEVETVEPPG